MRLYCDGDCIHSHRVRLVLAEKNIDAEIDIVDPQDIPEDLIHLNPYQSLPTLVDRDLVLYDAGVITEYLDERYPHPPFLPLDPVSRARARLTLYRMEKDWYSLLPALDGGNPDLAAKARQALQDSVTASAKLFAVKTFFLSDDFSLLDAYLVPLLWRFNHYGINLTQGAEPVKEYQQRMFSRSQFQESLTELEKSLQQ